MEDFDVRRINTKALDMAIEEVNKHSFVKIPTGPDIPEMINRLAYTIVMDIIPQLEKAKEDLE